jgi:hypothetical protein
LTELVQLIVSSERAPRAEVHHGQAGVGEVVIIHCRNRFLEWSFFKLISNMGKSSGSNHGTDDIANASQQSAFRLNLTDHA